MTSVAVTSPDQSDQGHVNLSTSFRRFEDRLLRRPAKTQTVPVLALLCSKMVLTRLN